MIKLMLVLAFFSMIAAGSIGDMPGHNGLAIAFGCSALLFITVAGTLDNKKV